MLYLSEDYEISNGCLHDKSKFWKYKTLTTIVVITIFIDYKEITKRLILYKNLQEVS